MNGFARIKAQNSIVAIADEIAKNPDQIPRGNLLALREDTLAPKAIDQICLEVIHGR